MIRLGVTRNVAVDIARIGLHRSQMLRSSRIRCRKLKRLFEKDDESKIRPDWRSRVRRIVNALDVAVSPQELNLPGYKWHEMSGDRKGTYSVLVSHNWRITFRWDKDGPFDVDLEDYHGS